MAKGWWIDTAGRNLLVSEDTLQTTSNDGFGDDVYEILVRSPDARADARRTLYGLPPERRAQVVDLLMRAEAEAKAIYVPPAEHTERIPSVSLHPFPFDTSSPRGIV